MAPQSALHSNTQGKIKRKKLSVSVADNIVLIQHLPTYYEHLLQDRVICRVSVEMIAINDVGVD